MRSDGRTEAVRASFFVQDAHGVSRAALALPDPKRESPLPGWASTKAATAAAETAAAPTEVARTNRRRSVGVKPSDDHVGGTRCDSSSSLASAAASRVQTRHGVQTPK